MATRTRLFNARGQTRCMHRWVSVMVHARASTHITKYQMCHGCVQRASVRVSARVGPHTYTSFDEAQLPSPHFVSAISGAGLPTVRPATCAPNRTSSETDRTVCSATASQGSERTRRRHHAAIAHAPPQSAVQKRKEQNRTEQNRTTQNTNRTRTPISWRAGQRSLL